jgi:hypothetical protein
MKHFLYLLLLTALASCSTARQLKKAEKFLAEHRGETPPDAQLSQLIAAHPELQGRTVRTVTVHDTIRLPGKTITVEVPAISTKQSDNLLVDSLMNSAAKQLHAKDSLAFAERLRAILAARPRLRSDTLRQVLGNVTVKTWVDKLGIPHTTIKVGAQNVAFEKQITQTGPVVVKPEVSRLERIWLFIKDAVFFIIGIIGVAAVVWLIFFIKRQREKSTPHAS